MELHFTCRKCGGETEADLAELADDPVLVCEECGYEADPTLVGDVAGTLDEMVASATRLAKTFYLNFELKGEDDLPVVASAVEDDDEDEY